MKLQASLPFIGRSAELEQLLSFCQATRARQTPAIVWLYGAKGTGKSRLLNEAAQQLSRQQILPLKIRLFGREEASILDLLEATLPRNRADELHQGQALSSRLEKTTSRLRQLLRSRQAVLVIDDLHLLSNVNLVSLLQVLRGIHDMTFPVFGTGNSNKHAVVQKLGSFLDQTVQLPPLTLAETEMLLRSHYSSGIASKAAWYLYKLTGGNLLSIKRLISRARAPQSLMRTLIDCSATTSFQTIQHDSRYNGSDKKTNQQTQNSPNTLKETIIADPHDAGHKAQDVQSVGSQEHGRANSETQEPPLLQLIGPTTIHYPNGKVRSVRGYRVRQILGLMVANQLLRTKLSADEFREVAADSVRDTESSANITRVNLTRIRSMLGKHALIAENDVAPRLNLDHISVDVINVSRLLDVILDSITGGYAQRVFQKACEVFSALQERTIYANMYGNFFDMARADFEIRVRKVLLMAAEFLRRQGEEEHSLHILRECFQVMPGDEEVEDTLRKTLLESGHSAEAMHLAKARSEK